MAAKPYVNFRRLSVKVPWWLVVLVVIVRAGPRFVRFVYRSRRAIPLFAVVLLTLWAWHRFGWLVVLLVVLAIGAAGSLWAWRDRASFRRWIVLPSLARFRRFWIYRRQWTESLTLTGLHKQFDGGALVPQLLSLRCKEATDEVVVRMLRGQVPEMYQKQGQNLAYSFGFRHCRVFSRRRDVAPYRDGKFAAVLRLVDRYRYRDRPRLVTLLLIRRDALVILVRPFPVPAVPDFTALVVGIREDLERYTLHLLATHVLIAGATRAGKGSVLWSIVRAVAGGIASGLVCLWGIDPKGGVEFRMGFALFSRYEDQDYEEMADMLDDAIGVMRRRQSTMAGNVRAHKPTQLEPLYIIMIDELAALTAYLQDNALKSRILASLGLLLSQGAGLGILIVAATQDPRKETTELRDLFPTRIALRLNEPGHVNLVLGDGARDRGALADQIPNDDEHKGIAYVEVDGYAEPARVRFSYNTDDDVRALAATYPAPPEFIPARPVKAPAKSTATKSTGTKTHAYKPGTALKDGPLLPAGLVDAVNGHEREGL